MVQQRTGIDEAQARGASETVIGFHRAGLGDLGNLTSR